MRQTVLACVVRAVATQAQFACVATQQNAQKQRAQTAFFLVNKEMPPKKVQSDRTALDELMAQGLKHKKQERWVVLGGLLMQGHRTPSYEEIRELAGYHADKALPSGYSNTRSPDVPKQVGKRR